jgi:hypothetical protein
MAKIDKKKVLDVINEANCFGYFGYGQGKAATVLGDELGETSVCFDVCPKSMKCRQSHCSRMDSLYPEVAKIVKKTIQECTESQVTPVEAIVWAMAYAASKDVLEACKIQEGLKRFGVNIMCDHYIYGQLENLDNGINSRDPQTPPVYVLVGAKL